MSLRVTSVVVLLAAIAACVYFFLWAGPSPVASPDFDAPDSQAPDRAVDVQLTDTAGKKSAVDWKRLAALENGGATASHHTTAEDIARFLAKHGETAVNLVAVFEQTNDRCWLDRALELSPNSPIVLMAAVNSIPSGPAPKTGELYTPDAIRMAYIERFKTADPNNPLPWIYSAAELFKAGQTGDAAAEIRAALERPAFYTYAGERMDSAQQLLEDGGYPPVEASLLATVGLRLPEMSVANQVSRSLAEWQKSATDASDPAAVADAIRVNYDLGRTFATPEASRTLIGQLVGIAMEKRALEALPAGPQPDWLAVPPSQRLAEIEAQKQNMKTLIGDAGYEWLVQRQDEQLLAEFLRRNRTDGEFSALTWLKAQKK